MSQNKVLEPYVPLEMDIIKETVEDGKVTYCHLSGGIIQTYRLDIVDLVEGCLGKFDCLLNMMDDESYKNFGFVAEAVLRVIRRQLEEAVFFIEKNIGDIRFELVSHGNSIYREGRVLDACLIEKQDDLNQKKTSAKGKAKAEANNIGND